MKINLLILMSFCLATFTSAQTPKVEWIKAIGGIGNERANSIETDNEENIILIGRFQSLTIEVDNIMLTKNTADNADVADIFIIKLDKNWKATITRYIDSGDGVFVIGFYEGTYNETGKYMKADFACEYKIKDDKITEFNKYTDTFLIGQAMGLTKEYI